MVTVHSSSYSDCNTRLTTTVSRNEYLTQTEQNLILCLQTRHETWRDQIIK